MPNAHADCPAYTQRFFFGQNLRRAIHSGSQADKTQDRQHTKTIEQTGYETSIRLRQRIHVSGNIKQQSGKQPEHHTKARQVMDKQAKLSGQDTCTEDPRTHSMPKNELMLQQTCWRQDSQQVKSQSNNVLYRDQGNMLSYKLWPVFRFTSNRGGWRRQVFLKILSCNF